MKTIIKSVGVVLAVVALALCLQLGEAVMCYKCTKVPLGIGSGGECTKPDATTGQISCNSTCRTKFTFLSGSTTTERDCGTGVNKEGCDNGSWGTGTCYYSCSTELCNIHAGAPRGKAVGLVTAVVCLVVARLFA